MKNLVLSFLLILSFLTLAIQTSSADNNCGNYNDVQIGTWYCPALSFLQERGVLAKNSNFNPGKHLNRAEALKVLMSLKENTSSGIESEFFDIGGQWFTSYFQSAYAQGFIKSESGKMNAWKEVSKAEFIILFMQVFDIKLETSVSCYIGDTTVSPWLNITEAQKRQYLCAAKNKGISTKFSEYYLERAVAMGVLYKGITGEEL